MWFGINYNNLNNVEKILKINFFLFLTKSIKLKRKEFF